MLNVFCLKRFFLIIISIIIFTVSNFSQTQDNLSIFYKLVDSSVTQLMNNLPPSKGTLKLNIVSGESYSIFNNRISSLIFQNGYRSETKSDANQLSVNYVLEKAKVNYGDIFRDGFFGAYLLTREIKISGNYLIQDSSYIYKKFHYINLDTVEVDNVRTLENASYPFTQGNLPPEPLFSSMFEPLVAIGTAAVAVLLFFTIRSK